MKINGQTKISVLIKHDKDAIEAIASINPHFNKLKNPILRRVVAPRVTIEDAARIGKCEVNEILQKLSAIGFEIETISQLKEEKAIIKDNIKIMQAINSGKVKSLDVRPVLEEGTDPFKHIMDALKELPDGYALEVINSFEPTPLIKILNKKGYASYLITTDDIVRTYFIKVAEAQEEKHSIGLVFEVSMKELEYEREKYKGKCQEIDVREMEMPFPMVTILNKLENLQEDMALFIHHKKVPQYLLPELEERQFKTWIAEIEDGNVKMLIHK